MGFFPSACIRPLTISEGNKSKTQRGRGGNTEILPGFHTNHKLLSASMKPRLQVWSENKFPNLNDLSPSLNYYNNT